MGNIISWYNKNRKRIWITIIAIAGMYIIVMQLMNLLNDDSKVQEANYVKNVIENTDLNTVIIQSSDSAISGETITTSGVNQIKVIDQFMTYCNQKQIEEAYKLLSNECKEEMYSTVEIFKESYYDQIFNGGTKNVSTENWIGDIYKIKITDDFLATGVYTEGNSLQDYITIVKDENGEYKLNINNYIKRKEINKSESIEDIQITVVSKDVYMDYEVYTLKVINNSDKPVLLVDTQNLNGTYLEDSNQLKYTAYLHEKATAELGILSTQTKDIKIKYYNKYSSTRDIESIVFQNIILDYTEYVKDKENYSNYGKVKVIL